MITLDPIVTVVRASYKIEALRHSVSRGAMPPRRLSDGELSRWLADRIYRDFHSGSDFQMEHPAKDEMYDPQFSRRIVAATPTADIWVPTQTPPTPVAGGYVAMINGLRVRMPDSRVRGGQPGSEKSAIRLPPLRPHLSPGYLYYSRSPNLIHRAEWRVYVSVADLDSAVEQWAVVLNAAREVTTGQYHAKVASTVALYPRRDAIVVYFNHTSLDKLQAFADRVTAGTVAETSRLAHTLSPGVSCAHEPRIDTAVAAGASFGQHRSTVLARLLVDGASLTEPDFGELAGRRLMEANIDPHALYLNSASTSTSTSTSTSEAT